MNKNNKIHFEVSERKVLLRVFDVIFIWLSIYLIGNLFDLEYLKLSANTIFYALSIGLYVNGIGTVFELYNLQVSSNQYQVLKSVILTVCTSVLLYLLTPVYSAELPPQRLQILVFFFTILLSLLFWRIFYVKFLASNRFVQNVILVCDFEHLEELVTGLESADPHYRIIGYVNSENYVKEASFHYVPPIKIYDLVPFVNEHQIFEIIVASQKKRGDYSRIVPTIASFTRVR